MITIHFCAGPAAVGAAAATLATGNAMAPSKHSVALTTSQGLRERRACVRVAKSTSFASAGSARQRVTG